MNANASRTSFDNAKPFLHAAFDHSVLSSGRRAPPVFPAALFSPLLSRIASDFATGCSAPLDYVGASMLAVAGAAIGGSRSAQAFEVGGWCEPSILWVGLVGDPSSAKSPAIDMVARPLHDLEREMAVGFGETLRRYTTEELSAKLENDSWSATVKMAVKDGYAPPVQPASAVAPMKPSRPRLIVKDATPEAVQVIVCSNPRLLCNRDELSGFLDFERYNPGGRSYWLEAYGGRDYKVDRKSADGPIIIPFNGISVLGGIQPDKLASVFDSADDGLAARFLWVWPLQVPYERPTVSADAPRWAAMVRRLASMAFGRDAEGVDCALPLQLDPDAADAYTVWRKANALGGRDGGSLYKGMVGKMPGLVMRLCLVLELLDWAEVGGREPDSICLTVLVRALEFVELYAKPMALRVFGDAALSQVERNAATVARHILDKRLQTVNLATLRPLPGLREAAARTEVAEFLIEAGWLTASFTRAGPSIGRAAKDYVVNPGVHTIDASAGER